MQRSRIGFRYKRGAWLATVASVLSFCFLVGGGAFAQATCTDECYVDAATGDDANNGNVADPFATIQQGVDTVSAGGEVLVAPGTYNEQVEISTDNITLTGAGASQTSLVATVTCTNQMNGSATAGVRLAGNHTGITLEGFSASGYDLGLDIGENIGGTISDVTITSVDVSGNCVHGILSQAGDTTNVTVDNVTANNNGAGFFAGRGLWFINGTKSDVSVTNSTFNNNRLVGLDISDGDVTGLTITGNTVIGNGDSGIGVLGPQGPGENLVSGNTVTDNGRYGIEIKNPSGTTLVSDNNVSLTGPASDERDYAGISVYRRSPGATNADQPSGVEVRGNTVSGFVEPNGNGEGFGIVVEGTGMSVLENDVSGNDVGIQVQEGNPSPNTNSTLFFDRGDASVAADVSVNSNNITGNTAGMRAIGVSNDVDGTENWWGDASGPSGEGPGTGDSVSTDVIFEMWLDAAYPDGSPVDNIPPMAVCGDLVVKLNLNEDPVTIAPEQIDDGSSDNIAIATRTLDVDTFTANDLGNTITVTLTVTDTSGNQDTCTGDVFVTSILDFNADGIVSPVDAVSVINRVNQISEDADIDNDGDVDGADVQAVIDEIGTTP